MNGWQTVVLGPSYDDIRDRPALVAKLAVLGRPHQVVGLHRDEDGAWIATVSDDPRNRPETTVDLGADVKPTSGAAVSDWLFRERGLTMVEFKPYARTARARLLGPWDRRTLERLAEYVKAEPWTLDIAVEWTISANGVGEPTVVYIDRFPAIPDPEKRRETYGLAVSELLPPPDATWWVAADAVEQRMVWRRAEDPLGEVLPYPWELEPTYSAIPFAVDIQGDVLSLGLIESNLLLGGTPGSGKSGGATALLAGISRLPNVSLIGLDPKRVELSLWRPRFSRIATQEDDSTLVLSALTDEMERRYEWLEGRGLKKVTADLLSPSMPLLCLLIDELADLVSVGVTKEDKAAEAQRSTMIRRLIAKGRAAGVVVIAATQKPQSDVVPTALRDLIQQRVGYATTNAAMSETILGAGMAQNGGLCHEIPASLKGVCFVVDESSSTLR